MFFDLPVNVSPELDLLIWKMSRKTKNASCLFSSIRCVLAKIFSHLYSSVLLNLEIFSVTVTNPKSVISVHRFRSVFRGLRSLNFCRKSLKKNSACNLFIMATDNFFGLDKKFSQIKSNKEITCKVV